MKNLDGEAQSKVCFLESWRSCQIRVYMSFLEQGRNYHQGPKTSDNSRAQQSCSYMLEAGGRCLVVLTSDPAAGLWPSPSVPH